jgi:hypothetical protein
LRYDEKDIHLELQEFGHKAWETIQFSFSIAILNQDIFSLNITEFPQPLPKSLDPSPRSVGITTS